MGTSFAGLKAFVLESIERMRLRGTDLDAAKVLLLFMVCKKTLDLLKEERSVQAREGLIKDSDLDELCNVESLASVVAHVVERNSSSFFSESILSIWSEVQPVFNSDLSERNELVRLWDEFRCFSFDECNCEDGLASFFEWFLVELAERNSNKGGYFFTPDGIVNLMVQLLDPKSGEKLYDPVCGSGEFLIGAINKVKESSERNWLYVLGRERSAETAFIAMANAYVHGISVDSIEVCDALARMDYEEKVYGKFDLALANPPFSLRHWDGERSVDFLRYGLPPQANADFAFIQNVLFSLNENGRAAMVVPMGVLFRGGVEREIRRKMLLENNVDAIISIPPMSFYGTAVPANILIMRKSSVSRDVLFIDGSSYFSRSQRLNRLGGDAIDKIVSLYAERKAVDGVACCVPVKDLEESDWNLTVSRYVAPPAVVGVESVATLLERQEKLQFELSVLQQEMRLLLSRDNTD
ncbi:N-6 DNA methylase [Pseudomonas fluorescens]|uniref:N-6 DNA methylase n=1 Tax=Pseudomonas fluorescens TaxID=294 RepID=UPI00259B6322|nr:N-6 DNA methylase [Pseudomonas fluorescens]WJK10713.1 N-6 DNA methylase [Pseudomonas fluorescens]